jgi:hypothetical protein
MEPLDITLKIVALILSCVAIFQLFEVRKKRHIDMFWKIYEIYTSEAQKTARKDTTALRKLLTKTKSELNEEELLEFYSENYHLTNNENQKNLDRSIMNRIRFFNQIGMLLKKGMINKRMLFELIGLGLNHDYATLKFILDTHRRDHGEPNMYSMFEITNKKFTRWKQKRELRYK